VPRSSGPPRRVAHWRHAVAGRWRLYGVLLYLQPLRRRPGEPLSSWIGWAVGRWIKAAAQVHIAGQEPPIATPVKPGNRPSEARIMGRM
jgi:hypothetical protein